MIVDAKGSCGCTVPEWPKAPIAAGADGEILVNSTGVEKPDFQNRYHYL